MLLSVFISCYCFIIIFFCYVLASQWSQRNYKRAVDLSSSKKSFCYFAFCTGKCDCGWIGVRLRTLKGKLSWAAHDLSKFVCGNMPGFLATFRSLLSGVISFATKGPSYAGDFALHRCRLESNLKSSGCLFQVKLLVIVSL